MKVVKSQFNFDYYRTNKIPILLYVYVVDIKLYTSSEEKVPREKS
jgi:hypothetical protein